MKVVITHTDFRLYWPARLKALHQFMQKQGADLRVIEIAGKGSPYSFAQPPGDRPEWWECLFPENGMEELRSAEACAVLEARLDEIQPDVVMAGAIAFTSGATAVRWCRKSGKGCVIFDDARRVDVSGSILRDFIKRRIYRNVDAMLIPAQSHLLDYEWWGVSRGGLFLGVDVVDNDCFRERADRIRKEADGKRREYALPEKYFLGVGRQIKKKNWHTLIKAFCQYRKEAGTGAWSLVLVGNGIERPSLERLVPDDLRGSVYFTDFKTQEDLSIYYALAGVMVLPSHENWGLVVNEALASGLPVLVSRECGCAETLVHDGKNGWTFDPDDIEEMSDKMLMISRLSDEELSRMGKVSQDIITPWGLNRFTEGAWQAIRCASQTARKSPSILDRIIINLWKGRYRPT